MTKPSDVMCPDCRGRGVTRRPLGTDEDFTVTCDRCGGSGTDGTLECPDCGNEPPKRTGCLTCSGDGVLTFGRFMAWRDREYRRLIEEFEAGAIDGEAFEAEKADLFGGC